ncbi:MAG: methyltransferase domain-containing protein [Proteobacteria bacterium]|nr:MAG: methyltransferase domain-containing protein [Pseudomonadota bacterium]
MLHELVTDNADDYTKRNVSLATQREPFFSEIFQKTGAVGSVCELGANRGENLRAIRALNKDATITGVEINQSAVEEMATVARVKAVNSSILDFNTSDKFDLVFTCGVLIHLDPESLQDVYEKMYQLSSEYILINEYFNPVPVGIPYRGHSEKLFKRDFGGEFLDRNSGKVEIVSYGFLWSRANSVWDDTTWSLFRKK